LLFCPVAQRRKQDVAETPQAVAGHPQKFQASAIERARASHYDDPQSADHFFMRELSRWHAGPKMPARHEPAQAKTLEQAVPKK
jgi:hypothetical protein